MARQGIERGRVRSMSPQIDDVHCELFAEQFEQAIALDRAALDEQIADPARAYVEFAQSRPDLFDDSRGHESSLDHELNDEIIGSGHRR
jgi:hypothetical protein